MGSPRVLQPHRTDLFGAQSDNCIDRPLDFIDPNGSMARDVDPDLGHDQDGLWPDEGRL